MKEHTLLETNIDVENPLFVDPAPMKNHGFSTSMLQEGTVCRVFWKFCFGREHRVRIWKTRLEKVSGIRRLSEHVNILCKVTKRTMADGG